MNGKEDYVLLEEDTEENIFIVMEVLAVTS
jgi:hypothetical protein